jgi:hypothetical protein
MAYSKSIVALIADSHRRCLPGNSALIYSTASGIAILIQLWR